MTNFLNYECPKCTDTDEIDVAASVWLRLTGDGTDADQADNGDHEYDGGSRAVCQACGFEGKFHEFEPPPEPVHAEQTLDVLRQALAALNTARNFTVPSLSIAGKRVTSYDIAASIDRLLLALTPEPTSGG